MISIIVNNENLDLYEENEINFEWTSFAFSKSVKEPYSTDFTIPKTSTNIRLLGLYNLQDETPFDFQEDYIKGVLIIDNNTVSHQRINVDIQVIKVNKDDISIFIIESNPVEEFLSKNLVKKFDGDKDGILIDKESTIFPWYINTHNESPEIFINYNYGSPFVSLYAQYHSSKPLLRVIDEALHPFGLYRENFLINTEYAREMHLLATNKYVCPQNHRQIIRGHMNKNEDLYVYGGQHVTNDISKEVDEEKVTFTINRRCKIKGSLVFSFYNKIHYISNSSFALKNVDTGDAVFRVTVPIRDYRAYSYVVDITPAVVEPGVYEFRVAGSFTDNHFAFLFEAEIYDYETTKEDSEIELEYDYRYGTPEIFEDVNNKCVPLTNDEFSVVVQNGKRYLQFSYDNYKKDGTVEGHHNKTVPLYFYSYFGYYCNLPEIKMKDFIYNLSWTSNRKISFDKDNVINFAPFKVYNLEKDYEITNTEFLDNHFGKTTAFKCKNEELLDVNPDDTFNINNKWLSDNVAIKESMFARLSKDSKNWMIVPQYSEFERDNDTNEYKCKYDEIEGVVVGVRQEITSNSFYLEPVEYFIPSNIGVTYPHIPRLLLDSIKQIFKVDITCYSTIDLMEYDFLNIDGRLYYIISGTKNIEDGTFNIKALLVNDTEAIFFNNNGELVTWQ